jgi:hypothetical protein
MAAADWGFGLTGMRDMPATKNLWRVTFDSDNVVHHIASSAALASLELWQATGEQKYADKAVELAQVITDSQQRQRPDWTTPLTGFFYTSPTKDRILHYCHRGREQAPILVLTRLCDLFPNHPEWMKWYSTVVLHSEYLKTLAKYTEPYGVLPASIYTDDEYLTAPETRRESFRQQVLNGIPLGAGHYLRLFPVWMDYRGQFGTILPAAQALLYAARLRGDLGAQQIAERQLEWIIGRNPFCQSTMWGEGNDFPPLYSAASGDMVGSLPVGIQTHGESDVPYWPVQSTWTYKEVWVNPVGRWIWAMHDLGGPAIVEGEAASVVEFRETTYKQRIEIKPDAGGRFRATLPAGTYLVRSQGEEETRTFLAKGDYHVDLRPGRVLAIEVSQRTGRSGDATIVASVLGTGDHRFALRVDNLEAAEPLEKRLSLQHSVAGRLEWHAHIRDLKSAWVAVVVPDGDLSQRREVTGSACKH